ncbi:hypothetical protein P5W04_07825 [Mycobacteroides abscessus subsp. abscessus]|uniref:hypothetical protein n=1 Tax=Mycolicibacterium fortuitum TaxID=1766 RepID=UPI0007FF63D4|nr:hypothetical protein [Mycolicibacterium fortuitum]MDO3240021.1 hypothetical protein [Mycobacteroides abscessus subsp. abscessus]OBG19110.1 hypothetical protein A5768_31170 [Mycolicibacterium fortuitum]
MSDHDHARIDPQRTIDLDGDGMTGYLLATIVDPSGNTIYALVDVDGINDSRYSITTPDVPRERLGPLIGGWPSRIEAVMGEHSRRLT